MVKRQATAVWQGGLKTGTGDVSLGSGAWRGPYSFKSRTENTRESNPEELIAAAHAGCFSMALSAGLEKAGFPPDEVRTTAQVELQIGGGGLTISRIALDCDARVPGIDDGKFREIADDAKRNCPVSRALSAVEIVLQARLSR